MEINCIRQDNWRIKGFVMTRHVARCIRDACCKCYSFLSGGCAYLRMDAKKCIGGIKIGPFRLVITMQRVHIVIVEIAVLSYSDARAREYGTLIWFAIQLWT